MIRAENENTKGAMHNAANRFERNQIDFKGLHTTSPSNALSGFSEFTLSVFRITSPDTVVFPIKISEA
tara:strand:- start:3624 stop:3827 length:204 start_codon:yes stop_codon:yes gene_type:complete